ncbi:VID27-domain-containing protein [Macrolepiota fuliginosa MF-IS2]|uniref:VID27-domain-containing protein n=1 Tax=Macrolepiota fuliginosa MF-IS2 TaxID=1400762 RepID=A0A9P5XMG6_9AGAR|nr:VID27-domain-containing protein [Macrolepiota fuliginosa MF-IS2]
MNIFRSLIGRVWQDPNAAEVVKISTGQLYLVRPGNIRSSRECIYNEAMVTIRRVPSLEHNFQLVATKVYEEGDQELLEDEEETDEERTFLISEELEFRTSATDGEPAFLWRDLNGDVDEFFEFVAIGTNEPTRAFFETCMYRAMYERKYRRSAEQTRDSDLEEFIWHPPAPKTRTNPRRKAKEAPAASQSSKTQINATPVPAAAPIEQPVEQVRQPAAPSSPSTEEILTKEALLYLWDTANGQFDSQGVVMARILRRTDEAFNYWLSTNIDGNMLLAHQISSDMNPKWTHRMLSITWNNLNSDGSGSSWCLRFATEEDYSAMAGLFVQCLWETLHQVPWNKIKEDEQRYVMSSTEDVEMADVTEDDEEEEVLDELEVDKESDDDEEEEFEEEEEEGLPSALKGDRNSQLTVGYKGDRSYVVRGNNIGVFNHSTDVGVKYYATISKIATPKGKEFKPRHVMLHDQDTKMILMNPGDPNSLYSMDIERGKVVEEWKVHEDIPVLNIAPENKFAPTTREQTVVGTSSNALFRIDPRISGDKLVESQYKQYVSKNQFSGVTTTRDGKLAVASEKGDIRLFDSIGKNAKTALPPLGDPIIGIDVTADGRYIVSTTKTYLLLIDTLIGEGRYAGQLGFDRSFPANAKPMPRRLQLRAEHVAYMGNNISFTPARFNQGEGQDENAIVTSTGQFVIAWDFAKVKKGFLDRYEIKKYEDHVVQDNFKFGDDKEIIVALDNNVLALNKNKLKKPTRFSLAGNALPSRSNIVNTPY